MKHSGRQIKQAIKYVSSWMNIAEFDSVIANHLPVPGAMLYCVTEYIDSIKGDRRAMHEFMLQCYAARA